MGESKQISPAMFVVALLLFATAIPLAHAQIPSLINAVSVVGNLVCPSGTGAGTPLSGVPVRLLCNFNSTTVVAAQNTTTATGGFTLNIPSLGSIGLTLNTTILGVPVLPCVVSANTTLISQTVCPALSAVTNTLVIVPTLINIVFSVLGRILGIFTGSFIINLG